MNMSISGSSSPGSGPGFAPGEDALLRKIEKIVFPLAGNFQCLPDHAGDFMATLFLLSCPGRSTVAGMAARHARRFASRRVLRASRS
jgi:hypothetical protein